MFGPFDFGTFDNDFFSISELCKVELVGCVTGPKLQTKLHVCTRNRLMETL